MERIKVLLAEDNRLEQMLVNHFITSNKLPYDLTIVNAVKAAEEIIQKEKFDIVISDYYLTDGTAMDILKLESGLPVIVITGSGDQETAINVMKAGAYDYLVKTAERNHLKILPVTIEKAIQRKDDENKLNMLSKAIMSINESVYFSDMNNTITYVNKTLLKTFGYTEEEIIGKDAQILFNEKSPGRCLTSGETYNVTKKGYVFPVYIVSTPIEDKNGSTFATSVIIRDITERKKSEEELKNYSEHLENLVKERSKRLMEVERLAAIGETAAMVGHDLRNPLQVLVNNIYIAKLKLKKMDITDPKNVHLISESFFNTLSLIEDQTLYMNKIVSDLQDFAKNIQLDKRDTDVNELINNIISSINKPEKVDINVNFEKDFPSIRMDKSLMQRVFTNLITNAVQAIPGAGKINIIAEKKNGSAVIKIDDTGAGLSPEAIQNLFKPLFTTKSKGVGLGLSVCKRIIDAHSGDIKMENKNTNGTLVTLTFPIERTA